MQQLSIVEIQEKLDGNLSKWKLVSNQLVQEFLFKDFIEAFGFMTQVALLAHQANHHPDWYNVYNKVKIIVWTHDSGGITQKDIDLASAIDNIRK